MTEPKRRRERPKGFNWGRFFTVVAYTTLFLMLMFTSGAYTFWWSLTESDLYGDGAMEGSAPKIDERVRVLVMGLDEGAAEDPNAAVNGRTDTMMVASFDPETEEAAVLSIPRDTKVELPGQGTQKINAAYAFGGVSMAVDAVENLLGTNVHYYALLDLEGFQDIVDTLGGVELEVDERMYHYAASQNLLIDLYPGKQQLDGERAMQYVRYRGRDGDIGRVERQQKFMKALADEAMQMGALTRAPQLFRDLAGNLETNMDTQRMMQYGNIARQAELEDIEMETLAGNADYIRGISYWLVDEQGKQEQVQRLLLGVDPEVNEQYNVRVLNGGGIQGSAAETAQKLRRAGFNVVDIGNAERMDYQHTRIIPHVEDPEPGRLVARSLQVQRLAEREKINGQLEVEPDVTVVVGSDWNQLQAGL